MAFRKPRTPRQIKRDTNRVVEGVIFLAADTFSTLRFTIDTCVQINWRKRVAERLVELGCNLDAEEDHAPLVSYLFHNMLAREFGNDDDLPIDIYAEEREERKAGC